MNTTTSTQLRRVLAITVFSALASGTAVCSAADGDSLQTTVNYSDLNVSSAQGAGTLYSRIRAAAEKVCRPLDRDDLASKQLFHACVSSAISGAVGKVDQPALFSVYNAKTGTAKPIVLASSQGR
jgi:UrcA family protein